MSSALALALRTTLATVGLTVALAAATAAPAGAAGGDRMNYWVDIHTDTKNGDLSAEVGVEFDKVNTVDAFTIKQGVVEVEAKRGEATLSIFVDGPFS